MKTPTKKSNKIPLIILGLACVGLAFWVWKLNAQVETLQKENADLAPKLAQAEKRAKAGAAEVAVLKALLPAPQTAGTATSPADAANSARKRNLNSEEMTALMKNPAMQSIISSQQTAIVQMGYKDLMDKLKLSPEERDYMTKLIVQRQMDKMNIGSQYLNPALTPDEKTALGQQFVQAQQTDDTNMQTFLNDDTDYATYQAYNKQETERTEVGMVETALAGSSEPLDPTTADALTNLMDTTRQNFSFTVDFNNESNFANPANLNGPTVNKFLDEETQYQAQVADKAASMLTPAQLDAFKQNQAAMLQMTKQKLNSILQLSGGAQ